MSRLYMGVGESRTFAAKEAAVIKLQDSSAYHSTIAIQTILLWQVGRTTANVGKGPCSQQSAVGQRQHTSSRSSPALSYAISSSAYKHNSTFCILHHRATRPQRCRSQHTVALAFRFEDGAVPLPWPYLFSRAMQSINPDGTPASSETCKPRLTRWSLRHDWLKGQNKAQVSSKGAVMSCR